jgi:hypothetical protein
VIVTVYEPAVPEHDSVEVPLEAVPVRVTLVGETVHVSPVDGEDVVDKETVPVRLWTAVTVMVEVPDAEARTVTFVRLVVIVKSCTV